MKAMPGRPNKRECVERAIELLRGVDGAEHVVRYLMEYGSVRAKEAAEMLHELEQRDDDARIARAYLDLVWRGEA
ncbi:MAG: hypothetical protein QN144_10215 [Armatimonadota bacterium]|nr:hypothetical protein [Armatimonadota bacterium]